MDIDVLLTLSTFSPIGGEGISSREKCKNMIHSISVTGIHNTSVIRIHIK